MIKGWFNENRKAGIVLTAGIIPVSAVIAVLAQLQPYQIKRIEVLFHPERYAQGAGYQAARTREVIEGLTMFGTGGVKPEQLPIHMLPGVQDDYNLLQVASVYGIIAAYLWLLIMYSCSACSDDINRKTGWQDGGLWLSHGDSSRDCRKFMINLAFIQFPQADCRSFHMAGTIL
ncbi:MAG: FtsW/RodA/SpoVE family cell cycle protein [Eisenbergiella sp.]